MPDIDYGTGPNTGDTVRQAFEKHDSELASIKARLTALEGISPTPTPTPSPVFTTQPSITPSSGNTGATFTGSDGVATNAAGYTRRWLLNGTAIGTGTTVVPGTAGSLVFEVTAINVTGETVATSAAVTVSTATTPAPVFSVQPSISPTSGAAGATFTGATGTASNTTSYARRWLLNGTQIGTGATVVPVTAGTLVLEITATGPGGNTIATSSGVTVSSGTPAGAPPSGMTLWADFGDASTLNGVAEGQPLTTVSDKSGNGNTITATNATRSGPGAMLNGTTSYLAADGAAVAMSGANKPYTIVMVAEPAAEPLGTARTWFSAGRSTSSSPYIALRSSSSDVLNAERRGDGGGSAVSFSAGAQTAGGLEYWIEVFDGTTRTLWRDGFAQRLDVATASLTTTLNLFTIGALRRSDGVFNPFSGRVREVILYPTALDYETGIIPLDAYIRGEHYGETARRGAVFAITAGQSNASGRAFAADTAANSPVIPAGAAWEFNTSGTADIRGPLANPVGPDARAEASTSNGRVGGAWPQWAKTWNEQTGDTVFLLSTSEGATALQPTILSNAGNWDTIYRPRSGSLFLPSRAADRAPGFHARLMRSPRYDYYDQGATILWHQGESDAGGSIDNVTNNYTLDGVFSRGNYTASMVALRDYYHSFFPVKRVHISELGAHDGFGPEAEPDMVLIRQAQADACAIIPNGYISSGVQKNFGIGGMADSVHYAMGPVDSPTALGYNGMGYVGAQRGAANRSAETAIASFPTGARLSLLGSRRAAPEGGTASFIILRSNSYAGTASVNWSVTGGASGTETFADGEIVKAIFVSGITGSFTVTLSNPTGATLVSGFTTQTGSIAGGAVAPTLGVLSLDNTSATEDVLWTSEIVGKKSGSTIAATASDSTTLSVTGSSVSGTFANPATVTVTLVETLAGATGSPKESTGSVVVAAAGGGTPVDPDELPPENLVMHYDFDDRTTMFQDTGKLTPVTAAGQPVAVISDKSGNDRDALTGGTVVTGTLDGHGTVVLDGTTSRLNISDGIMTLFGGEDIPQTVHWVEKTTAAVGVAGCHWSYGSTASINPFLLFTNNAAGQGGGQKRGNGGGTQASTFTSAVVQGAKNVWSMRINPTTFDLWLNGTQVIIAAPFDVSGNDVRKLVIGARSRVSTDSFFAANYGEHAVYSVAQSDATIAAIQALLIEKWAA